MFGRATEVSQFTELLESGQHLKGMRLFDQVSKDPALCSLVLDSVVMSNSNQSDPSLHTPHGLPTTNAARGMLAISGFPAGVPLLRFITLYSFSLRKRALSAEDVRIKARTLPSLADPVDTLYSALEAGDVGVSGAVLARIAMDRGIPAAAHAVLRYALNDLGKLGQEAVEAGARRLVRNAKSARLERAAAGGAPAGGAAARRVGRGRRGR